MRARRLVAVATVAALGVLSLGACGRSAPDVAAYVGDTRYSIDRVDAIYDEVQAKYADAVRAATARTGATPGPDQLKSAVTRQDVVNLLVSLDLGKRVAAEKRIQVPDQVSAAQLEQLVRVPADTEYARLWGEWYDVYATLNEQLPPAELSDEAVMAVYQALVRTGQIQSGLGVAQVRQAFGDGEFVRRASAISAALKSEADQAGASINPRYRPIGVPGVVSGPNGPIIYALPYVDESGPVTDISTPETSAPARV